MRKTLSHYVKYFDEIDRQQTAGQANNLTPDQAAIFRDIFATYKDSSVRFAVLDAKSGSGKTTLIRAMQKYAKTNKINIAVTASTGKAASALGGSTIHSYMGLSMAQNDEATSKDDALKLTSSDADIDYPDILIIDESSMVGQKIFSEIDKRRFDYVLFVLDSSQLPPVKEKKVEWQNITFKQYTLTKTLRAKDPRMMKFFEDFRKYKNGEIEDLDLNDYVNDDNIVSIDYKDLDFMPKNTESCIVGYRNRLVEHLVDKTTHKDHDMYNLNIGVTATMMIASDDVPNHNGYFNRTFENELMYYNGEDVKITKLTETTQVLVEKGWTRYNNFNLSIGASKKGITCTDKSKQVPYGAKESPKPKQYLKFPPDDVLEHCTLAIIDDSVFVLLWDNSEEELNRVLDSYFQKLLPHLKIVQAIKKYWKTKEISSVDYEVKKNIQSMKKKDFNEWFKSTPESSVRTKRWADFLSAKSVISARHTTARTVHKSQGISVPCVVITDQSFFGASLAAQYVAATRGKHGIVLVENTPNTWNNKSKNTEEDDFGQGDIW